jgi:hypothetical protein
LAPILRFGSEVTNSHAAGKWFASSRGMVALTLVTIHPSAGKGCSANFASTAFSDVPQLIVCSRVLTALT